MKAILVAVIAAFAVFTGAEAKLKEGECEVCVKCVGDLIKSLSAADKKTEEGIEKGIASFCKALKPNQTKEERWCYYIGGSEQSATRMLKDVSVPVKNGFPAERICERLGKTNAAVCELKFEKKIDINTVDLNKLKVKDLKKILMNWGEACDGCVEKPDFIKRINELKSKHTEL
eukprot:comp25310_c0_seq1/m.46987 comp25310_c0_seq1/g.46987  ORF comp25310_c0_seq1/g.46987 comp25310_c0_seq1/m.46987 type:complete len:174 (-) comp25310_c0_seq1:134-655(-)